MRAELSRKSLREALTALKPCLPPKPLTELDGAMLLSFSAQGWVSVSATDMLQEGVMTVSASSDGDFEVVPDLKKFEKVITKTETDQLVVEYEPGSGALRVSSDGGSGFVDVPTFPAAKKNRYDAPTRSSSPIGSLEAPLLSASLAFIEDYLPETLSGQMKFEVALLRNGVMSGANGWNRRGFFVSRGLSLPEEVKFLQRFVQALPKVLAKVPGKVDVYLQDRTITLVGEGFQYSCVRALHEVPDPVLSYLKSSDPYLVVNTVQLTKLLDRVAIPDYQAAGAPVGVRLRIPPASADKTSEIAVSLVAYTKLEAEGSVPCIREAESPDTPCGLHIDKVVDYRMFKAMAGALPASAEVRAYVSNPSCRYFKFQGKYTVADYPCVAVSVGSYSKVIGNAAR